jgi:hypothetical protein
VHEIHLALAVPPPRIIPLGVEPQSQRAAVGFHLRVLETHEHVEMSVLAKVFVVGFAHLKQPGELPFVIMTETGPQSQNPLEFQTKLSIQLHE